MSKIVNDNIGILDGMTALYGVVSDEASMDDEVVVKGCSPVTNDPKVKTIVLSAYTREPAWNIQNKTHWCFATAALIMVSGSIEKQDYKYMNPDVKPLLDAHRAEVANNPNKYRDRIAGGVRDITPFGNAAAGIGSDSAGRYFYCDTDQEYVATNYAFSWDGSVQKQHSNTYTSNNYNASARDALIKLYNSNIVSIVETSISGNGLRTWMKEDGSLNYDIIKEHLITPLREGKKVLLGASNFIIRPDEGTTIGHSYIATGLSSDKEQKEIIQVYDPWAGKKANNGQFGDVSVQNLFKGFWSPIIAGQETVKTYMTVYFVDKAKKVEEEKPVKIKLKQPIKTEVPKKLKGRGAE